MRRLALLTLLLSLGTDAVAADGPTLPVGVAQVDVTPAYPIRLSGYGNRKVPNEGVVQKLRAKALAIGDEATGGPLVIVTVDNLGVPASLTREVASRLQAKAGLPPARLAIAASHTHCGPCLTGVAPLIFGTPIVPEEQAVIDRYTRELTDAIEKVSLAALADRKPGRLAWGEGSVGFAANRRVLKDGKWVNFGVNPAGPTDRSLPLLRATDTDGAIRAVLVNYACHCTTLGGDFNQVCGDWSGYAQDAIERDHPGAIALVAIGCGADANPEPRGKLEQAKDHGAALAAEAARLLKSDLKPLAGPLTAKLTHIELPFGTPPTREQFEEKAKKPGAEGLHARVQLERLDHGGLQKALDYPVQTWCFGDDLAMVFLAGEVVVDYDLRLKRELDAKRLWLTAYANDDPCYIASRRLMDEGGYEVDSSMWFYDRPCRLSPLVEDRIVRTVRELLPDAFRAR